MSDPEGDGALSELPACVSQVRVAIDELYRVLFATPFPDLDQTPTTDEEVRDAVTMAKTWARSVDDAYGDPDRPDFRSPTSVADLFARFNPGAYPHAPWNAADVVGDIPLHLRFSGIAFFGRLDDALPSPDPKDFPAIQLVHGQWSKIRVVLHNGHVTVLSKALALVTWVEGQIEQLQTALFPTISTVSESGLRHVVEVNQAGRKRTVAISSGEAEFLAKLAEHVSDTYYRTKKHDLLKRIPELGPWIHSRPPRRPAKEDRGTAVYEIPASAVRARIHIRVSGPSTKVHKR